MSIGYRIADWAVAYRADESGRRRIRASIRDFAACAAVGGSRAEMAPALSLAAPGDVPVWGGHLACNPASAALVTSVAGSLLQLHDLFPDCGLHPSSAIIPACWAAFHAREAAPSRSTVDAVAAGYEVAYRIASASRVDSSKRGYAGTSVAGAVGAAVGAALMLGYDKRRLARAVSNTASTMPVTLPILFREHGELAPLHSGVTARAGLEAALLAKYGDSGTCTFEGDDRIAGLAAFLASDVCSLDPVTWNGDPLSRLVWKLTPACFAAQTALEATLDLPKLELDSIREIVVTIPSRMSWLVDRGPVRNHLYDRLMSLRWAVAVCLRGGHCHGAIDANEDSLAARIRTEVDPALDEGLPDVWRASVLVLLHDGRSLRAERRHEIEEQTAKQPCCWTGHLDHALLDAKYRRLTSADCKIEALLSPFLDG